MAKVIDELRADHANYRKYLAYFEKQAVRFGEGEDSSLEPLKEIAAFFAILPDRRHHRIEDAIFDEMDAKAGMPDMHEEHGRLFREAKAFHEAMEQIFLGQQISREAVRDLAVDFIAQYRRHLAMEEDGFFPAAERLGQEQWAAVNKKVAEFDADPLEPARMERIREAEEDIAALCG